MQKFVKLVVAVILAMNLSLSAYANEFETNVAVSDNSAKITGTADCAEGTIVSVVVVRPGKDIFSVVEDDAAKPENSLNSNVLVVSQTTVDSNNKFEYDVKFAENEKSGVYTLRVQVYGEKAVREQLIVFKNDTRIKTAETLIQNSNVNELEKALEEYASDIDIESGEEYLLFSDNEKEYVIKNVSEEKDDKKTGFINSVNEILAVHNIKNLDKEGLKAYVEEGDVVGVDEELIEEYEKLSSLKKDLFVAEFYKNIADKETPKEISDEFSKAIEKVKKPATGGGSNGGGGGGSSTGSFTVTGGNISNQTVNPEKPYVIETPENEGFKDMESAPWAKVAVDTLYEKGIIKGRAENLFCPGETVKREEFLKMIIESLNIVGISEEEKRFTDVKADAWYSHYVDTGVGCGIITGISESEFGIGMPIKREDMATMLYRAIKYAEFDLYEVSNMEFTDENEISEYAKEAVKVLSSAKVINGLNDGSFMPKKTATRAEAAVMLYNMLYR